MVAAGFKGDALGTVRQIHCGRTPDRNFHLDIKRSVCHSPEDLQFAIGSILESLHPVDTVNRLWLDYHVSISGATLIRAESRQRLIEPGANPVVAVVDVAAPPVPVFPGSVGPIVDHIQISWIIALFQHFIHELGFSGSSCPLGEHRNANQAGG